MRQNSKNKILRDNIAMTTGRSGRKPKKITFFAWSTQFKKRQGETRRQRMKRLLPKWEDHKFYAYTINYDIHIFSFI